jgi:CheY-like chemotaxis protein
MSEVDGYELLRRIRNYETQVDEPRTPALALTAYARPEDRAQALEAGYQTHICKPVEPGELVAALARLMKTGTGDEASLEL